MFMIFVGRHERTPLDEDGLEEEAGAINGRRRENRIKGERDDGGAKAKWATRRSSLVEKSVTLFFPVNADVT